MEFAAVEKMCENLPNRPDQIAGAIREICKDILVLPEIVCKENILHIGDDVQIAFFGNKAWLLLAELNGRIFGVSTANPTTKAKYLFKVLQNLPDLTPDEDEVKQGD